MIPDPSNPQAWNRFGYVHNNPINFNDPTGHKTCSDDGYCGKLSDVNYQKHVYSNAIKDKYEWGLEDNWSLRDIKSIYQTGHEIEKYVDGITKGKGLEWMKEYLGGTKIARYEGSNYQTWPDWAVGENTIYISQGKLDYRWFSHELGHIWDINSGSSVPCSCGVTNGVADQLNHVSGGYAYGPLNRSFNYDGKAASYLIPEQAAINGYVYQTHFLSSVANGYGNGSVADYLAESFSWNVYDSEGVPVAASVWVDNAIIQQAIMLP